jgi:flagellar hook-length control protein FliK
MEGLRRACPGPLTHYFPNTFCRWSNLAADLHDMRWITPCSPGYPVSEQVQFNLVPTTPAPAKAAANEAPADGDVFAALLDADDASESTSASTTESAENTAEPADTTEPPGAATTELNSLETTAAAEATEDAIGDDPQQLMEDLVEALTALDTAMKNGETPDAALLEKISDTIDALAALLDIPQDQKAEFLDAMGALAGIAITTLVPALAPLVSPVETAAAAATSSAEIAPQPELAQLLTRMKELAEGLKATDASLADKLTSLADKLGSGKLAPDLLAKLSLGVGAPTAPEAEAEAPAQVVTTAKPAPTLPVATPQPFSAPQLQIPEKTALTAPQAVDVPAEAEATDAADEAPRATAEHRSQDRPAERAAPSPSRSDSGAAATVASASGAAADQNPANATQSSGQTVAQTQGLAAPKLLATAYQTPQMNLPQLAFEIVRQVQQGASRFQIRLDPPELGRIDVKLDVDASGNVNARLTVERSETLDLLQRDQRGLERALAQAGVDTSKTNLEFSLKQNPFERQQGGGSPFSVGQGGMTGDAQAEIDESQTTTLYRGTASAGGVNILA